MNKQSSTYQEFLKHLNKYKKRGEIVILHRGMRKHSAFYILGLNSKCNSIEKFAERLFFYGDKAKYFWEQRTGKQYGIEDVSNKVFELIFNLFNEIANKRKVKEATFRYIKKNKIAFDFFKNKVNLSAFLSRIQRGSFYYKRKHRNYYFRIIHQLDETQYNLKSQFISSSKNPMIAQKFAKNEIVINFWDFNFLHKPIRKSEMPLFIGKPYKNQKEISLFSAIFPHYIYSFKYKGEEYINRAIEKIKKFDYTILSGLDIDQKCLEERLKKETRFEKPVFRTAGKYHDKK